MLVALTNEQSRVNPRGIRIRVVNFRRTGWNEGLARIFPPFPRGSDPRGVDS